jgi:hypothetical protein
LWWRCWWAFGNVKITFFPTEAFECVGDCFYNEADGCYIPTPDAGGKAGAVWGQADTTPSFQVDAVIHLGSKDQAGADGVAFAIQNIGDNVIGGGGSGLGYTSLSKYFAVTVDTYYYPDTIYVKSKSTNFGPTITLSNVKDSEDHAFRVT